MFRSLNHLEFVFLHVGYFIYDMRECSNLIVFCVFPVFPEPLAEGIVFSPLCFLIPVSC